jgi:hypothetical protein
MPLHPPRKKQEKRKTITDFTDPPSRLLPQPIGEANSEKKGDHRFHR